MSIEGCVTKCCGRIPELFFGRWEPHAPGESCAGCWACQACVRSKLAQFCVACQTEACVHHAAAGHPANQILAPEETTAVAPGGGEW